MIHVITEVKRPSLEIISSFKQLGAATVYEASGRNGSVDPRIKPLNKGMQILGAALTVQCHPKDNLMLHKALQIAQPGDIIVANTGGYPDAGYFGDLMATSAIARQVGGLAIDGSVRDSANIISMGFSVFCRGTCMRGTVKNTLGSVNHDIVFGGVVVRPGDLIIGDDDGIVAVPENRTEEVLEAALKRTDKEKEKEAALSKGITSVEMNRLDAVFERLKLKEQ